MSSEVSMNIVRISSLARVINKIRCLAGSEGIRASEAMSVNLSLTCLGTYIDSPMHVNPFAIPGPALSEVSSFLKSSESNYYVQANVSVRGQTQT